MSISEYRKSLEREAYRIQDMLLSKVRTEQLTELQYLKGLLDGTRAALRRLDEMEKSDG